MDQNNQQLIKASVVVVIIAGALGALMVLAGDIGPVTGKIFALCFSLIIFGITGTICMVVTRKPEYKTLGGAGMVTSGLGFLMSFIMVVGEVGDDGLLKLGAVCLILSIALAHICLLHHFTLQNKYAVYARITATTAIAIFSFCLITRVFEPIQGMMAMAYNQSTLKILLASFVVDLGATLLVPLCNRLKVDDPADQLILTEEPPTAEEQQAIVPTDSIDSVQP
ncbi:MAG TPA: hypothetical protein VGO58_09625 [Chitinophagaceae bacterium]|jgi:hypothetical protein|nr:hypothetical protein [Chitinophagaceae bacterium]